MDRSKLQKRKALAIAKKMKEKMIQKGLPIQKVYLFGSVASDETHKWSDIDIAVVVEPFNDDFVAEYSELADVREDFDVPMDIIHFHPEDMENKYSWIVQEIKRNGIQV